ncbi:hypothetical protein LCGC14_0405060 [marine sediment metagenome]|uniref:Uncharacterized protein n=1 Tax=marine sediment metagenome TaxID=412755 RepID=A0A0F9TDI1_9ZZZZ
MTIIRDSEDLLLTTRDLLKDHINTFITKINTEKGDTLLDPFSDNEFFFFFRGKPNLKKMIYIFNGDVNINSNRGGLAQISDIFCWIVINQQLNDDSFFKSLRYMRAIQDTLNSRILMDIENTSSDITLEQIAPFDIEQKDKFPSTIVSGVRFSIDIAIS